jgi:hypothetical protein
MGDTDAEAQRAHATGVAAAARHLLQHQVRPGVVRREQVGQALGVVSGAAPPRDGAEVHAVVDAEIGEGHQPVLVDRVPDA